MQQQCLCCILQIGQCLEDLGEDLIVIMIDNMILPNEILTKENGFKDYDALDRDADILGEKIDVGSYVIYQPYSRGAGMHVGKIVEKHGSWYKVLTFSGNRNNYIDRHAYELVAYLPFVVKKDFNNI